MADNTTTYKTVIETEVKGKEEMKDLGDEAEETGDKFVKLQLRIRQTQKDLQAAAAAGDKAEFKKLRAQLDELEEGLEKVQFQAKQFDDQLASLPGPAGAAGNAIKAVDGAFKLLLANPYVAILGALVGIFLALKKSLDSTAEGQALLNRISSAFAGILGPILATLEKIAIPIFDKLAMVLEFVASGFSKAAQAMGISSSKIKEATLSVDKVQQEVNDKEKKRQEELTKKNKEAQDKRAADNKAAAEKRKAQREKELKEIEDNQKAAQKVLVEAYIATLSERDQEIYNAGLKQNERLLALEKAGIKDKTAVLEQGRLEIAAINKKYDDEEAKKVEEANKKKAEDDKKREEDAKVARQKELEDRVLGLDVELEFDAFTFDRKRELISQKEAELLQQEGLTQNQRTLISKQAAQERQNIDQAELDAKAEIQKSQLDLVAGFGSLLSQIAGKNKALAIAGIVIEQGAALGKVLIDTARGISSATAAAAPFVANPLTTIPATANLARTLAQIKISGALSAAGIVAGAVKGISAINQSGIPGGGGSAAGGASIPGGSAPTAPTLTSAPIPQINTGGGQNPTAQIAESIGAASGKPVKAYVLQQDVSNSQAFARRTNNAATF